MNKRNHIAEPSNHREKMVLRALSPVGAPSGPERKRYFLSYAGIEEWMSDRGGKTDAR